MRYHVENMRFHNTCLPWLLHSRAHSVAESFANTTPSVYWVKIFEILIYYVDYVDPCQILRVGKFICQMLWSHSGQWCFYSLDFLIPSLNIWISFWISYCTYHVLTMRVPRGWLAVNHVGTTLKYHVGMFSTSLWWRRNDVIAVRHLLTTWFQSHVSTWAT